MELVYITALKAVGFGHTGSSPVSGTNTVYVGSTPTIRTKLDPK